MQTNKVCCRAILLFLIATLSFLGCEKKSTTGVDNQRLEKNSADIIVNTPTSAGPAAKNFVAPLKGSEEVPPVGTNATGLAKFQLKDGTGLSFKLIVANIEDVVASHIHCAPVGQNGPVGVTLFSGGPATVSGILAQGTLASPNAGNGCGWADLAAVVSAMRSGNTYVNVHTLTNPPGEIRGQVLVAGPK